MLCSRPPQAGHLKPSGHRDATITARHCSSLPYCRSNAGSLSPFWNCTALRAISIPPPKALVCSWFVPYPGRLSKVRNQVSLWAEPCMGDHFSVVIDFIDGLYVSASSLLPVRVFLLLGVNHTSGG